MSRWIIICAALLLISLTFMHNGTKDDVRAGSHAQAGPVKAKSLCAKEERVLWSCEIKGQGKQASICGSKELDQSRGYVQYRFERLEKIEMEFPRERINTQSRFVYFRYTRPRVTHLALKFENEGATYIIYQDDNSEEGTFVNEATINVRPAGANAKERTLRCRMPTSGTLMSLENLIPHTTENWL